MQLRTAGRRHARRFEWCLLGRCRRPAVLALLVLGLAACGSGDGPRSTGVLVVLEADAEARAALKRLEVRVRGIDADGALQPVHEERLDVADVLRWPRRFVVEPLGGDARRGFRVTVRGFGVPEDEPLVVARVRSGFVEGQWRQLTMLLTSRCFGVACDEGESCEGGACVPDYKVPEELPPAVDEADGGCLLDEGCQDDDPCTVDWCLRGRCVHGKPSDGSVAFRAVATGPLHTCAVDVLGRLWCWGADRTGRLAPGRAPSGGGCATLGEEGTSADRPLTAPYRVMLPAEVEAVGGLLDLDLGGAHGCAIDRVGRRWCWGDNGSGQVASSSMAEVACGPVALDGAGGIVRWRRAALGRKHSCFLREDGVVACQGRCAEGQLGEAACSGPRRERMLSWSAPVVDLAAGAFHGCLVDASGRVACWGSNLLGQLGVPTDAESRAAPQLVEDLPPIEAVHAGAGFSCATDRDGGLWCWGDGGHGQLGRGEPVSGPVLPGQVVELAGVGQVALGQAHACAVGDDGWLRCWGSGDAGQLGLGDRLGRSTPTVVEGLRETVVRVSASVGHTCAIDLSGRLWCWGAGDAGQLGVGDTRPRLEPARVQVEGSCP